MEAAAVIEGPATLSVAGLVFKKNNIVQCFYSAPTHER